MNHGSTTMIKSSLIYLIYALDLILFMEFSIKTLVVIIIAIIVLLVVLAFIVDFAFKGKSITQVLFDLFSKSSSGK